MSPTEHEFDPSSVHSRFSSPLSFMRLPYLLILLAVSLQGCKSNESAAEAVPPASYPPPLIPVSEPAPAPAFSGPRLAIGGPLRPGDTVELFVEEDDSFNGTYPVREQGDIILRSVGRVQVAGLSVASAGSRIQTELESRHLKKATVLLDRTSRAPQESILASAAPAPVAAPQISIYLNGRVNRTGQHRLSLPKTGQLGVYEAILSAGGFANFADTARAHVLRKGPDGKRIKIPVDLAGVEKGISVDPPIGDGDIVVIPEKIFGF